MAGRVTFGKSSGLPGTSSQREVSNVSTRDYKPDDGATSIDWANHNYPPGLRMVHFDPDELPTSVARIARALHWMFLLAAVVLFINITHTIVLVVAGLPATRIGYSILNALILIPSFGATFYQGYLAMATSEETKKKRYYLCQAICIAISLYFFLSPLGATNGVCSYVTIPRKVTRYHLSGGINTFWMYAAGIESTFWCVVSCIGISSLISVKRFNPFHSDAARNPA
ncbi:scamp family protein [Cystoisospora suis]|uniref:Scamp family protein n=1 Tax=Cystoisospora suis TaxID=483139 RepID=A0A2C6KU86_9APIC|nr:scamp family protein [Cystoisospora suis]